MNIVIWGVNSSERSMTQYLVQRYFSDILFIVDNNQNLWGKDLWGKEINSPSKICEYTPESIKIIIATYEHIEEIKQHALALGYNAMSFVRDMKEEYSQFRLQDFIKDDRGYLPKILNINFTEECNLRCVWCYFHGASGRSVNIGNGYPLHITDEILTKVVESVRTIHSIDTLCYATAGELFMNRIWFKQIAYALHEIPNIRTLVLATNGMLLTESNVQKLIELNVRKVILNISIDGDSPEETEKYRRNSSYNKIKQNVHRLISLTNGNDKFELGIQCYRPLKPSVEYGQENFPQYLRDDFPRLHYSGGYVVTPNLSNSNFEEYGLKSISVSRDIRFPLLCRSPFEEIYFDCFGNMRMCACGQFSGQLIIGSYNDQVLDIWQNNEIMQIVRQKLSYFESCQYCGHCIRQNTDLIHCLCEV